ncbi:MAG TPA: glycosyltransferase family 39 protein [Thermoleophilaceae bacterium]
MRARPEGFDRAFAGRLLAIAAGGLALRLLYVLALTPDLRGRGDSAYYHDLAAAIAAGDGFTDPARGTPTALHPPLLPLVLALGHRLGADSYLADRVVVCVIGAAAIVAVGLLARRVAGPRAGTGAAALAAAYPVLIGADGAVMAETLLGLLVVLALLAAYALADRPAAWRAALLGALAGLAALTRGEALFLVPLLVLPACLRLPARRAPALAAALAAFAVVLAPWTIRNATTFDRFVPLSTNEGTLLAGANCPSTYGGSDIGSWDIRCVPSGPAVDESEAAADLRSDGLEYASDHAGRVPLVVAARLARTFGVYQPVRQARHAEGRSDGIEIAGAAAFLLVAAGAAAGAVVLRRRGQPLWPLLTPVALAALASVVGYGVPRFRHPADLAFAVLAAVALAAAAGRGREPHPRGEVAGATGAGSTSASAG